MAAADNPGTKAPTPFDKTSAGRNLAATLGIVALVTGSVIFEVCAGARPDRTAARCEQLLDRFVELRVRAANPKASDYLVEQQKAEAREQAQRTAALELCSRRLTEDAAVCAERATSADELEQCFF